MEKCCTNKYIRVCGGALHLFCILYAVMWFAACAVHRQSVEYPDFTDEHIFNKETEDIKKALEKDTLHSLWRAALLVMHIDEQSGGDFEHKNRFALQASALFTDCALYTEKCKYKSVEEKKWARAVRFAESLEAAHSALGLPLKKARNLLKPLIRLKPLIKIFPFCRSIKPIKLLPILFREP